MRIVYRKVLSDVAPHQTSAGRSCLAYAAGEELVVYEENSKFYYFLDCVSKDGLAYETDDVGPFSSLEEALDDAYGFIEWSKKEAQREAEFKKAIF